MRDHYGLQHLLKLADPEIQRAQFFRRSRAARPFLGQSLQFLLKPLRPVHRLSFPYHGLPGKGSAFRLIFSMADALGARACAVVDSDLRSITP
ncbi:MAG: hypothetical protein N2689_06650, partial [Verrucomicrobiae bacterium]|nr:hypothetical protein [Verrucomicrobiae bacterium]